MNTFTLGLVVVIYFLSLVYLGWLGYKKTKSADDYLVGGRQMNPIIMSLSYGATFISTSAIVGFGGVSAAFGMGIQWLCLLNMLVGVVIAFIFFGRKTRSLGAKLNVSTFPQLLGAFYKSKAIQIFVATVIFVGMPIYAAVVLKGGAVFIEQIFNIDFNVALLILTLIVAAYVIAGGIKGVMYTDALQGVIMFACTLFLLIWLYKILGLGFVEANQKLTAMAPLIPENLQALGHRGWTSMPAFNSPQWYVLVTSLILGVGIGCLAQPQLVVRFLTVNSTKQLNRGVFIGSLFILVTVGTIYHAGPLSNIFFYNTEGKIASQVVSDMDKIIPYFIDKAMPNWFTAVFMLCILSAGMSTLSSQFHTMGTAAGADIYANAVSKKKAGNITYITRLGVVISIVISYIICYTLSAGVIARGTAMFMGICASTFLPAYFCALYWKRVTRQAAIASMWVGALSSIFALVFLHKAEASVIGLCKLLFGTDYLIQAYPWYMIDPILFSFPLTCITIWVVSLMTQEK